MNTQEAADHVSIQARSDGIEEQPYAKGRQQESETPAERIARIKRSMVVYSRNADN
jgi:hypothetical protein